MIEDTQTVSVLVVDDHGTFAELLALALGAEPDLACVGIAVDRADALRVAEAEHPDVAVVDLRIGPEDGISLATDLMALRPGLRVVILTAHADHVAMRRASAAGVCALLAKNGSLLDLLRTIRRARTGGFMVDRQLLHRIVSNGPESEPTVALTPREQQVLEMLASGLDARATARALGISLHTCRSYIKNVLAKLDAHSQLEAVATATRVGIVSVPFQR